MIELSESRLRRSGSFGTITGGICLRLSDRAFPASDWDDFVVPILTAWADAATRLLSGASTREQVHFMDGPFAVEITQTSPDTWTLDLIERRQDGPQVDSAMVDPRALAASVVDASGRTLRVLAQRDWRSRDVALLAFAAERLRSAAEGRFGDGSMPTLSDEYRALQRVACGRCATYAVGRWRDQPKAWRPVSTTRRHARNSSEFN